MEAPFKVPRIAGREGRFTPAQGPLPMRVEYKEVLSGGKPTFRTCNYPQLESSVILGSLVFAPEEQHVYSPGH